MSKLISISANTVKTIESITSDMMSVPCMMDHICTGPRRMRSMMTCHRCNILHRLRQVTKSLKEKC